jgi:quaternary ammonium compound-resistance protein SugE
MPWILLAIAGGLETIWALGLREVHGFSSLLPGLVTVSAMLAGFALLAQAIRSVRHWPVTAAYVVLGALGVVMPGAFWLQQGMNPAEIGCLLAITGGIVSLQFIGRSEKQKPRDN